MKEFKDRIDELGRKKAVKATYKQHKGDVLKNAKALYTGMNIILDAFEKLHLCIHLKAVLLLRRAVNQTRRMTWMILILRHQEK